MQLVTGIWHVFSEDQGTAWLLVVGVDKVIWTTLSKCPADYTYSPVESQRLILEYNYQATLIKEILWT